MAEAVAVDVLVPFLPLPLALVVDFLLVLAAFLLLVPLVVPLAALMVCVAVEVFEFLFALFESATCPSWLEPSVQRGFIPLCITVSH